MAKFNSRTSAPKRTRSVLTNLSTEPDTTTYEGAPAFIRTPKSELFILGVSNFVGEPTFYESAEARDGRFAALCREVAVSDPQWFADFVRWLRAEGNMRSAPIMAAAQGVHALLQSRAGHESSDNQISGTGPTNRQIVSSVLQRADEPAEFLAYWASQWGTQREDNTIQAKLPMPVKRGIADALERLYDEYSAFKYDTASKSARFGDLIELTHPVADSARQGELYRWLLDRRHNRADGEYPELRMLAARKELEAIPATERAGWLEVTHRLTDEDVEWSVTKRKKLLQDAGATWEWLSSWLGEGLTSGFWEAMIPNMGYMALLRNLNNFDKTGVSDKVARQVCDRLADPAQVAKSRQFPYRFLSAYGAISHDRWKVALGTALDAAITNIPELPGRTLVLVDTSGSMTDMTFSSQSRTTPVKVASLFGVALAHRNPGVKLVGFATSTFDHRMKKGFSVLSEVERFTKRVGEAGHGTETAQAMKDHWNHHDRVIVLTDEQSFRGYDSIDEAVPEKTNVFAFNLSGYPSAMLPSKPNRYQLGGITDATFRMIPQIEAGIRADWPWARH